jgi:hypothetical protein
VGEAPEGLERHGRDEPVRIGRNLEHVAMGLLVAFGEPFGGLFTRQPRAVVAAAVAAGAVLDGA